MKLHALLATFVTAALLAGCAALPPPVAVTPTHAIADGDLTKLGKVARDALRPGGDGTLSGFRLMPEADTAFNARIALARRAQKSLDVQYYLIADDQVGLQFLRELRDAAQRGVRVRLLVDDLYTAGEDPLLTGLAAFANVEVRLFNPLPSRSSSLFWRVFASLRDFSRIDHRMHNKLMVADNSFAVSGGRNMADAYFMQDAQANFIDFDVMSTGPVVREMSRVFDTFWNSAHVDPIARVVQPGPAAEERDRFDRLVQHAGDVGPESPRDVLGAPPVAEQLDTGRLTQVMASARVFFDSPDKAASTGRRGGERTVTNQTLALFARSEKSVRIVSPYFVPGEHGMAMIRSAGATPENGRITLVTNSLGSTDEPLVYAEYARYRLDLLKAGVRIYEINALGARGAKNAGDFRSSITRLHAKVASIDERLVVIGSMNLDGRSAFENTEMSLVIDSAPLAESMARLFRENVASSAYLLRLTPDGTGIEWLEPEPDGSTKVHRFEPRDNAWERLQLWLELPFVSRDEL